MQILPPTRPQLAPLSAHCHAVAAPAPPTSRRRHRMLPTCAPAAAAALHSAVLLQQVYTLPTECTMLLSTQLRSMPLVAHHMLLSTGQRFKRLRRCRSVKCCRFRYAMLQVARPVSCALLARLRGLAASATASSSSATCGSGAGGSTHAQQRFLRTTSWPAFGSRSRRIMESGTNSIADARMCTAGACQPVGRADGSRWPPALVPARRLAAHQCLASRTAVCPYH
ncbi:hypothetical protein ABPG77_001651 [Micractinium sp. CCAP 211/92]